MISKTSINTEQPSKKVVSSKTLPVLLEEIQERTIPILNEAFKAALDKTDTSFFQRAEKGKSNNEQNLYFDAMRELRIGREAAEASFDKGLRESFSNFPLAPTDSQANGALKQGLELSLVQEDELEEDIALETMVTKATADNREAIYHLSMRLDALVADTHIDESNNLLSPASISEVLALAAAGIELDIRCKIILYKQFDLTVMASLKAVLRKSNKVLVDAGVLPDLRYKASKNEDNDSERAEQLTEALVSNLTELAELGASSPGPEFQQLQGLLSKARSTGAAPARFGVSGQNISGQEGGGQQGIPGQGASFQSVITSNELIGVLGNVQSEIDAQSGYGLSREMLHNNELSIIPPSAVRLSIRDALAQNGEQEVKAIEEENEDVINLVEMLFEIILDDNYLPGTIQALISRLQIPVIKAALKDRSFFNQPNHPARKLLNELARTSIGWTPGKEGKTDNLLENIYDVVHAICDAPVVSVELIEEQYKLFRELCEKERKRIKLSERRTREYELGASKVKHAKTSVKSALDAMCAGNIIPNIVNDVLYTAWSKVLYSTYLNEGPHSQEWKSALQTAEDLVWSVQPQADARYQGKRATLLPKLLQNLHTGLTEISYDPFESSALFSRLENAHIAAFRAGETNKVEAEKSQAKTQPGQDHIDTQNQRDDIEIFVKQAKRKINLASKKPATAPKMIDQEILSILKNLEENDDSASENLSDMDTVTNMQAPNTAVNTESDIKDEPVANTTENKGGENKAPTAIQRQEMQLQQQKSKYLKSIHNFDVDTWFVFQMPDGNEARCKLIEKMSETEELVFVNRKGQKAFVKSYAEMAKDLRAETVRILEGGSLIDRAFGRLVGKLKGSD